MKTRNIVLLGGSNSLLKNGLQKGIKDAIAKRNSALSPAGGGAYIL